MEPCGEKPLFKNAGKFLGLDVYVFDETADSKLLIEELEAALKIGVASSYWWLPKMMADDMEFLKNYAAELEVREESESAD